MSCPHCAPESAPEPQPASAVGTLQPKVVLLGNPNVGKSCLFNGLTGMRQETKNAPGTTVQMREGHWRGAGATVLDLPGTYSLLAKSPDEQVAVDALAGRLAGHVDLAVVLLDSTSLTRSLYLLGQVAQTGTPAVGVLTMCDVARDEQREVDAEALADVVGVPIVALDPRRSSGGLAAVVADALVEQPRVAGLAHRHDASELPTDGNSDSRLTQAEELFAWVAQVRAQMGEETNRLEPTRSDAIDSVLLHPWVGIPVFGALMWLLFQLATSVAAPVMEWAEGLVSGPVSGWVSALLGALGAGGGMLEGLLVDGILAGVGVVLSFAPLMAIMFLAISILDDSGYLARAAFVADRAMRSIGLDGRAILPLIVGFGCNLPALAATRSLPDARQRLITTILIPYTSCAARLTVYILLATAFFPRHAGTVIFGMYVVSVLLVILAGLVLRGIGGHGRNAAPLLLALPAYQVPRVKELARMTWARTWGFVRGAGKVIVITLTLMWALMAIPVTGGHSFGEVPVQDSAYGATAEAIAPVFAPAGFGSWQSSAALITGFVAKEVVVGSFAQSFAVDEPDDAAEPGTLGDRLRATFDESSGGHGGAAAIAFMVFVLAYTPCLATIAEQKNVIGWKLTGITVGAQLVVAWVLAVGVFQVLRLFW